MSAPTDLKASPIFPRTAIHLRSLAMTMAVMCYLACLATLALVIVQHATATWSQGLAREATVQLRHMSDVDGEQQLTKALTLIQSTRGVVSATALDKAAGAKLLEPWLGKVTADDLPIPRLIRIAIDEQNPPNFTKLEKALAETVKGASLDTHQRWQAQLSRVGTSLMLLASLVLILITLASLLLVSYAAQGVIAANREIIDVLELIGAEPRFISRQNDRQFFATGLFAGLVGVFAALLTCIIIYFASGFVDGANDTSSLSFGLAFGGFGWRIVSGLLLIPLLATLIAVWASRLTLLRYLKARS